MSLFLGRFLLATGLIALCFLGLGIGKLLKKKSLGQIKRCGNPEKKEECPYCSSSPPKVLETPWEDKKKK